MLTKEFVADLFNKFLELKSQSPEDYPDGVVYDVEIQKYIDKNGNPYDEVTRLYRYLLKKRGFTGKPKILKTGEFKKLKIMDKQGENLVSSPSLYHGFNNIDYGYNFLKEDNYHLCYARGSQIYGTFFTLDKNEAKTYTSKYSDENPNTLKRVLNVKLLSSKGVRLSEIRKNCSFRLLMDDFSEVEDETIRDGMRAFYGFLKDGELTKEKLEFREMVENSNAFMAAMLGFDYLIDDVTSGYLVNFNRGLLAVTMDELKKFGIESIEDLEK